MDFRRFKEHVNLSDLSEAFDFADSQRVDYIRKATLSKPSKIEPTKEDILNSGDLVLVLNRGNTITYYEVLLNSFWKAMTYSTLFKSMDKNQYVKEFIKTRFSNIVEGLGEEILEWEFKNGIMKIEITNSGLMEDLSFVGLKRFSDLK